MTHCIILPDLGDGVEVGTVVTIGVAPGDQISQGQTLLDVETDKVVLEIPADRAGKITELHIHEGDKVRPGARILSIEPSVDASVTEVKPQPTTQVIPETTSNSSIESEVVVSPADKPVPITVPETTAAIAILPAGPDARRLAREIGIPISAVKGSGPRGRISKADVKAFAKNQNQSASVSTGNTGATARPLPDLTAFGSVQRKPMSGIEQATAVNMSHAWTQIPHAWLQEKVDITELEAARQRHKGKVKSEGGALTLTAILVKAVAQALEQYPRFNTALDSESNELIYRDYCHIGVAVDTPAGLVVPKVENANTKRLTQIAKDLSQISGKARDRKLSPKDLSGSGFTISNLGGIGLSGIFPIVNWPQVAILGVAASQTEPKFLNGEFTPRLMMPLTLGFDHRVINGADGARFLQELKQSLQDPFSLLLG